MKLKTNRTNLNRNSEAHHDAAMAHALILAMGEVITHVSSVEYNSSEICEHFMDKVKNRADAIMSEWGFVE